MKKTFGTLFIVLFSVQLICCQTIVEEGKGIDSLTLGIKESKIINSLGENYTRKKIDNVEYILEYPKKGLSFVFDQDSIVYEIIINPNDKLKTKKGLIIKPGLKVSDVEKVYGKNWWSTKESNDVGFDIGITFQTKDSIVQKIVIEESDLEKGNDYSFYEYIEGVYIPKDLNDCFKEMDSLFAKELKGEIKSKTENDFTTNSHFGFGLWIRNNWALWKGSRLSDFFNSKGISHPDDMSGIILTSYHRKLNGIDIELDKQIKHYQDYWAEQKKE